MNIEKRLKETMSSVLGVDQGEINENTSSDSVEAWDSLKHMDLIIALEEEFDVQIPDDDVGDLTSYKLVKLTIEELV